MLIYLLTNNINGKRYVGKTKNSLEFRFQQHVYSARPYHPQMICRSLSKYGKENFTKTILEDNITSPKVLNEREIFWIAELNPEYNMTKGGDGGGKIPGFKHSEETKRKIAAKATGRPKTPEECAAISERLKGNTYAKGARFTEEARQKVSKAHKGNVQSSEWVSKRILGKKKVCMLDTRKCKFVRPEEFLPPLNTSDAFQYA